MENNGYARACGKGNALIVARGVRVWGKLIWRGGAAMCMCGVCGGAIRCG